MDVSAVTFLDAIALGVIVAARTEAAGDDVVLGMRRPIRMVDWMLQVTGETDLLTRR